MKNVYEIIKEYGEELDEFKFALSRDWETVLFKAIDVLHNIERQGQTHTRPLVKKLNKIIFKGQYEEGIINQAIQSVRELSVEADRQLLERLNEVQELLFAVKISMGRGGQ